MALEIGIADAAIANADLALDPAQRQRQRQHGRTGSHSPADDLGRDGFYFRHVVSSQKLFRL
jgi:hypothetical protein